jgi:hypothetical protein
MTLKNLLKSIIENPNILDKEIQAFDLDDQGIGEKDGWMVDGIFHRI